MTVLAVDLGGTHMRCARVERDGAISHRVARGTPHDGAGTEALHAMIAEVAAAGPCQRAVFGVPGRVDYRSGALEYAPNLPAGWAERLNEPALSAATGLPVAVANDADLAAVGEAFFGAGRGHSDIAYVTFSTGIGAGIVLGGVLLHGRRSIAEVGHEVIAFDRLPGMPSSFEDLASGSALHREATSVGLGPLAQDVVLYQAEYGVSFCAALHTGNITAFQFHPEKSHKTGMKIVENFILGCRQ